MSSLFLYTLNTAEQTDLFLSDANGKLNLEAVRLAMLEKSTPVDENGRITGEGFSNIVLNEREGVNIVECSAFAQSSLGYFNEPRFENGDVITQRVQHMYYSKANLIITEDSDVFVKFDYTAEENAKPKVKSLIESIGVEATSYKAHDPFLRKIQENYRWTAAKIDKIDKARDSTRTISYTIDPSNDQFQSQVDNDYREHGKMSFISFELPFAKPSTGTQLTITVKLYGEGAVKVFIEDTEINDVDDFKSFQIYLLRCFRGIENLLNGR